MHRKSNDELNGRGKNILQHVRPLHLIQEVEKWPILYDRKDPDRANFYLKTQTWHKVGEALFADWNTYSKLQKESKVSDLSKKWRNLRDTFKRQVEAEKKIRQGYPIKKKSYIYSPYMMFLLPSIQSGDNDNLTAEELLASLNRNKGKKTLEDRRLVKKKKARTVEKTLEPERNLPTSYEIDEDKHFLMSLVPSFRRMTYDEKLTAKVEILKLIKSIRNNSVMVTVDNFSYSTTNTMNTTADRDAIDANNALQYSSVEIERDVIKEEMSSEEAVQSATDSDSDQS